VIPDQKGDAMGESPALAQFDLRKSYNQHLNGIPTALYRLYDAQDRLLYVGVTIDTKRRFGEHRREKSWWPEVVRKAIEWFPSRTLAQEAEATAVREEKPLLDATHRLGGGWMRHPRPSL
jgi:predicted GIY-YIG superfamily endonuclease